MASVEKKLLTQTICSHLTSHKHEEDEIKLRIWIKSERGDCIMITLSVARDRLLADLGSRLPKTWSRNPVRATYWPEPRHDAWLTPADLQLWIKPPVTQPAAQSDWMIQFSCRVVEPIDELKPLVIRPSRFDSAYHWLTLETTCSSVHFCCQLLGANIAELKV